MTRYLMKVLTTYLLTLIFLGGFSQRKKSYDEPEIDMDTIEVVDCAVQLSILAEFMKVDLPNYAFDSWKLLFDECPEASKNIYISGARIYHYYLDKETDEARKTELFDTLMLIYDRRIEYFGDKGNVDGRKAVDILRYKEAEFPEAYKLFKESVKISGDDIDPNYLLGYMQTAYAMYNSELIGTDEFLSNYLDVNTICNSLISAKKKVAKAKRTKAMTEKVIMSANFSDCDALSGFISHQIEGENKNLEFLNFSNDILVKSGCSKSAVFASVNEYLLELNPNPDAAYEVAKFNIIEGNFEKASEFLKLAVENEENPEKKAQYLHQIAVINLTKLSKPVEARNYSLLAISADPDWGEPYFILASAIIEGSQKSNMEAFEKQATYWLAVDYCNKAKSVDPSVSSKANELINQYKSGFPSAEEIFFRSLTVGQSYKINNWIDETTTVKSK